MSQVSREDQGPFGNQQELINQTGEDSGSTEEGKEITNPFISHVDLARLTGHLKINCQTSFEEKALLLTVSCQEISTFCLSWSSQLWSLQP